MESIKDFESTSVMKQEHVFMATRTRILHQDSLGLFTHQFGYGEKEWKAITSDPRFTVSAEAFFRHDNVLGWHEVRTVGELTDQTSKLRPFATGCAVAKMTLK